MLRKAAVVIAFGALPTTALAGNPLTVTIDSPDGIGCVNNGGELFTGGFFGGGIIPPARDVPVALTLTGHGGEPISVVIDVDGFEAVQEVFVPLDASPAAVEYLIPSFAILDGEDRSFTVSVSSDNFGQADDTVTILLDRETPIIEVDLDDLPDQQICYDMPPDTAYAVVDNFDANPVVLEEFSSDGCEVTRLVTVSDACGNAQEVRLTTLRPSVDPIEVAVQAFRCGLDECLSQGPDADPVDSGTRVGAATASFSADGGRGCVTGLQARAFLDEDAPEEIGPGDGLILVPGDRLEAPGTYTIVAFAETCGGVQVRAETIVTVLDRPLADPGGVDERLPGEVENAPARHAYHVTQGDALILDGSGSTAPPELGGITRWEWDLDLDGENEFDGPGLTMVAFDSLVGDGVHLGLLSITAGNGGVDRQAFRVIIEDVLPTCDAGGPYEGIEGQPVEFDGSASGPGHPSDPVVAYDWAFGDGAFPQRGFGLERPNHTYDDAGEFTVTLIVEDVDSPGEPCTAQVSITDVGPIVEGVFAFRANSLREGDAVSFSIGTTRGGSSSDPISEYCWDYGDGAAEECGPALFGPSHRYTDSGDFEVCLRVRDEDPEDTAEGCINITVADVTPTVRIEGPAIATEGDTISFHALGLQAGGDADPLVRLEWDFGDGEVDAVDIAAFPMATRIAHTFANDGEFTVTVRAVDEDSFAEASLVIVVADVGPDAVGVALYPDAEQRAFEGQALPLSAAGSTPGNASDPIVSYTWDFGDGEVGDGELVEHVWADAGTFQVRLTVRDEDGSQASTQVTIVVANVAPRIFIETNNNELAVGIEAEFRLVVQDVPADRPPPFIEWDMGDGTIISNLTAVTHTYNALGDYDVRVRVDHPGEADEMADTMTQIVVTAAPPRFTLETPAQALDQTIQAREGERLAIRLRVESAALGVGRFDGEVIVAPRFLPAGAEFSHDRGDNPVQRTWIDIAWTPTFYQSGEHEISINALAPTTETTRQLTLRINVAEAGSPLLAGVGTDGSDGLLNLYRYGLENGAVTFTRFGAVELGIGARGLAYDERNGQRVFA
ncbi:MAG: PKD repeat protein, partial [Bradymonadia bacterium]